MSVNVHPLMDDDREQWEVLYHGYAEFYRVPMNEQITPTTKPDNTTRRAASGP